MKVRLHGYDFFEQSELELQGSAYGSRYAWQSQNAGKCCSDQLIQLRIGGVVVVSAADRDG